MRVSPAPGTRSILGREDERIISARQLIGRTILFPKGASPRAPPAGRTPDLALALGGLVDEGMAGLAHAVGAGLEGQPHTAMVLPERSKCSSFEMKTTFCASFTARRPSSQKVVAFVAGKFDQALMSLGKQLPPKRCPETGKKTVRRSA